MTNTHTHIHLSLPHPAQGRDKGKKSTCVNGDAGEEIKGTQRDPHQQKH